MKHLITFTEQDVFSGGKMFSTKLSKTPQRESVRCILFNKQKEVIIMYFTKYNHHIIPWWGIEWHETKEQTLQREILEETWYDITDIQEIGTIIHDKTSAKQYEIQYCYTAHTTGTFQWTQFSAEEISKWISIKKLPLDEAIVAFTKDIPKSYHWHFYAKSGLRLLQHIKDIY